MTVCFATWDHLSEVLYNSVTQNRFKPTTFYKLKKRTTYEENVQTGNPSLLCMEK